MNHDPLSRIITGAAFLELGMGLVFVTAPAFIVTLAFGVQASNVEIALCRCFGIAMFALGVACRPFRRNDANIPALRALLTYNTAIALCLSWLAIAGEIHYLPLWAAIVLHAGMTLLLVWGWTRSRRY